jgi:prevent-host-death family protein
MTARVGVRELRQNLSRYLERVRAGEAFVVTDRREEVARLIPVADDAFAELSQRFGATVPIGRLEDVVARLPKRAAPTGTTDAYIAETREERAV